MTVINSNSGHPVWDTLTIAKTKDMEPGALCIVLGEPASLDGNGLIYLVNTTASGGIVMNNGNYLHQYTGTASTIDKQTGDSDTTLDRAVLTDSLGDNGGPIFTTGNLNVDEFETFAANDFIGWGYATSTVAALIMMPISSFTQPTSISITGTFKIEDTASVDRGTGLDSSDITISSVSSNKLLVVSVGNLTGVVLGGIVTLRGEGSGKITVNF